MRIVARDATRGAGSTGASKKTLEQNSDDRTVAEMINKRSVRRRRFRRR